MLVLTRYNGQTLMINDDIRVTVLGISKGQVRLGIDAPTEISIMREELLDKGVTRENGVFKGDDNG